MRKSGHPVFRPRKMLAAGLECLGLLGIAMAAVIVLLGYAADRFSGTGLVHNYLPFAAVITSLVALGIILLLLWLRLRKWLFIRSFILPPALVFGLALVIAGVVPVGFFSRAFLSYRILVGGKEEAGRAALAHQVYAAYRRLDMGQLETMIKRAGPYAAAIEEAGGLSGVETDLLMGLAAAESSFLPRMSEDGGNGLFQITQAPAAAVKTIKRIFPVEQQRLLSDSRYNAHLGAATLRYYLSEMKDDLFLGLLAYNIGPANGGLRFIMTQYGATDFITIQPYLMQLPRDYPIRVLSYALAFRIKRQEGRLLSYEEGQNSTRIQAIGVPGLR